MQNQDAGCKNVPILGKRYEPDGCSIIDLNETQMLAIRRHNEKLKTGEYQLESLSKCPVCKEEDSDLLSRKDRYGLPCEVRLCSTCGLIRTDPRLTQESYADFYDSDYRPLYGGKAGASDEFFNDQYDRGMEILKFIQMHTRRKISDMFVVEVGAGAGGVLKVFRDQGADVAGCDFGQEYLEWGRQKHGLDLQCGSLDTCTFSRKPDLIIYSHVYEHILDPVYELKCIEHALASNGLVFIEVPGIRNIPQYYKSDFLEYLQTAHVFHFTLGSLKNIFSQQGFECVAGDEFVRAIFKKSATESSVAIESDYKEVADYLLQMERARPKLAARSRRKRNLKKFRQRIRRVFGSKR